MTDHASEATLFAARPARLALLGLAGAAGAATALRVNVWRNHAIEPVLALAAPYAAWAGLAPDWRLGPYDDTLQFNGHAPADVELLWLDLGRYGAEVEWQPWLAGRLRTLRSLGNGPIVLAAWAGAAAPALQSLVDSVPGARFADLQAFADEEALPLLDARTARATGTPLAGALHALLARKLVCHWLAGCALPPVKVLAVDLDHTLHAGVLGEDGVAGVVLTAGHAALQTALLHWRSRGVMLALVSRNEPADVRALFTERTDYPLRLADFSAVEVSWGAKADALQRIAHTLNIHTDAIAFVDDNPGELLAVAQQLPATRSVFAAPDAALTERSVAHLPGLWRWSVGADDAGRVADLQANAQRADLQQQAADPGAYFRALQVSLRLRVDPVDQLDRLAELCGKTNQFNLALGRLQHAELAARMDGADSHVASVQMRDRLADSGVIAVVAARRDGATLVVDELCISCRALGRGVEDAVVFGALRAMPLFDGCTDVLFKVVAGPRNQPARRWLVPGADDALPIGDQRIDALRIRQFVPPAGLAVLAAEAPNEP